MSMVGRGVTGGLLAAVLALAVWPEVRAQDDEERHIHERHVWVRGPTGEDEPVYLAFPFRNDRQDHADGERYPLVVALHGRGESAKGPRRGPRGWILDYHLPDAFAALERGRLVARDYEGFVTPEHLRAVNAELGAQPFDGAMVVMPYVPDLAAPDAELTVEAYGDWLAGPLLEQVRDEHEGAAERRESVGIDGVSLGGWIALNTGFRHPETFGAVGGIQPAIRQEEEGLAERAAQARKDGHGQRIRLLTSEEDPYLGPTRKLSSLLRERYVPHTLAVLPGPHDYAFNRGPGAIELLRFHSGALEPEPIPQTESR